MSWVYRQPYDFRPRAISIVPFATVPASGGAFTAPLAETVTITDALIAKEGFKAPLAETATITDAIVGKAGYKAPLVDLVTLNETGDGIRHVIVPLAETVTVTDAVVGKAGYKALLAATTTVLEQLTSPTGSSQANLAETVTVSEGIVAKAALQALLAATVTVSEAASTKNTWIAQLGVVVNIFEALTSPAPAASGQGTGGRWYPDYSRKNPVQARPGAYPAG